MSKHTPGPWAYEHGTSDQYHVHAFGLCVASTCDRMLHDGDAAAAKTWEEDEANARLIAAAPEMLAALREVARGLADPDSMDEQAMGWLEAEIPQLIRYVETGDREARQ